MKLKFLKSALYLPRKGRINIAYGDKKEIKEISLAKFIENIFPEDFLREKVLPLESQGKSLRAKNFQPWSVIRS